MIESSFNFVGLFGHAMRFRFHLAYCSALLLCSIAAAFVHGSSSPLRNVPSSPGVAIPSGHPIQVDGKIGLGEWNDAVVIAIHVAAGWTVQVLLKHDEANLYLAFRNLEHGSSRLYPELMLDPASLRSNSWRAGQWWLHASYNLCEGDGVFNVYRRNGAFLCSHSKPGWSANNPPLPGGITEFQISFAKFHLISSHDTRFGLALDVTNATGDERQIWRFWPVSAQLRVPSSWGRAVLQ